MWVSRFKQGRWKRFVQLIRGVSALLPGSGWAYWLNGWEGCGFFFFVPGSLQLHFKSLGFWRCRQKRLLAFLKDGTTQTKENIKRECQKNNTPRRYLEPGNYFSALCEFKLLKKVVTFSLLGFRTMRSPACLLQQCPYRFFWSGCSMVSVLYQQGYDEVQGLAENPLPTFHVHASCADPNILFVFVT